ncbi:MAG: biosynthetic arginine decarboxylase, partial [Planctomycetota bacterium]|nr:biosynthetic arginine decarboxylase [Planctomycetota bacterium]
MPVDVSEVRAWTANDSTELYNVDAWGDGYFRIEEQGDLIVTPSGPDGPSVNLKTLVDDLQRRGLRLPVVIRFSDILANRVKRIWTAFQDAIEEFDYQGDYKGVYPIKVNQERLVVEELVEFGKPYNLGLEAGSKPELLIALARQSNDNALIICNGYKDAEYIELALTSLKMGRQLVIVLDRFAELQTVIQATKKLGIRPILGARTHISSRGAGRWAESTGDRSKFGLTTIELVELVEVLKSEDMLDCLQLLHFHIGSQITTIRAHKNALQESCRVFVELSKLGVPLKYLDVGGGLAVDYDGSHTNFPSSSNYSLKEYAADVISQVGDICRAENVPHPIIISESGRSLTAHHSVLIYDVLGVRRLPVDALPLIEENAHRVLQDMQTTCIKVNRKNFQEYYHDALELREEAHTLFRVGVFNLEARATAEKLFWNCCGRINKIISELEYVPEELNRLRRTLADIYYCNFSVFQSVPDHWACKQLFPTLPIHRLNEKPLRSATLADLTCDSDGKVDEFIDLHDVKDVLELHEINEGEPYYIGMFLVGAYQEILGDLHNLFGDTHCVHVSLEETDDHYTIEEIEEGETI